MQLNEETPGQADVSKQVLHHAVIPRPSTQDLLRAPAIDRAHRGLEEETHQIEVAQGAIQQYAAAVGLQAPRLLLRRQEHRVLDACPQHLADGVLFQQLAQFADGGSRLARYS